MCGQIDYIGGFVHLKCENFDSLLVEFLDLPHAVTGDAVPVVVVVVTEPHEFAEDIRLLKLGGSRFGQKGFFNLRNILDGIHVGVQFIVEAAL